MANEQNLIPQNERTKSEQREIARKGGIASGRSRLKKKHGRELLRALLEMPETDARLIDEISALGVLPKDITNEVVMHARQIEKAKKKADTKAYSAINRAAGYLDEENTTTNNFTVIIDKGTADALDKWRRRK